MSGFESNTLSLDDPFEREQLLMAAEILRNTQADLHAKLHSYGWDSLVEADTLRESFPDQYEQLAVVTERLTGKVIAGDYKLLGYYRDSDEGGDDDEGKKVPVTFGNRFGSWRDRKRFIGVLQGLETITHTAPLRKTEVKRLALVVDPIETLPESGERDFYMRNFISGRLENPFNDVEHANERVFVPVDGVLRLDIDRSYLIAQQERARFLGTTAATEPPKDPPNSSDVAKTT